MNYSTRICSEHFLNASGRLLCKSEAPSQKLPLVRKNCPASKKKSPTKRISLPSRIPAYHRAESTCIGVNTEHTWEDHIQEVEVLRQEVDRLKQRKAELELVQTWRIASLRIHAMEGLKISTSLIVYCLPHLLMLLSKWFLCVQFCQISTPLCVNNNVLQYFLSPSIHVLLI